MKLNIFCLEKIFHPYLITAWQNDIDTSINSIRGEEEKCH